MIAMILAATLGLSGELVAAYPPPSEDIALYSLEGSEEVDRTGYKCVSQSSCLGGRVWNTGDNLVGCTRTGSTTCTGECKICLGSAAPVDVCIKTSGANCLATAGTPIGCGSTRYEPCFYLATAETINLCWCTMFSANGRDTQDTCWVTNCI